MYSCQNCGANLRFDIPSQKLKCPYCDSLYDCQEMDQERKEEEYELNVFTCSVCGGEILSLDQEAAAFCSYCGSSVIMEAKMGKGKRPAKIIPFKKTEDDCREAYRKKLGFFAPKELKSPEFLNQFRGIYIPYWSYSFSHQGDIDLRSKNEYRKGDYDITEYYAIKGKIDASYQGICFDASSSFDDEISGAIAPYDPAEMEPFSPAYLSGFYADVEDVPAQTYMDQANTIANEASIKLVEQDKEAGKYPITAARNLASENDSLNTKKEDPEPVMLPVWFLTWKGKDRVAYTTVNGQTGKIAANVPIDEKKFALASFLLAIPLYFLLNAALSLTAATGLFLSGILSLFCGYLFHRQNVKTSQDHKTGKTKKTAKAKKLAKSDRKKKTVKEENSGIWDYLSILIIVFFFLLVGCIAYHSLDNGIIYGIIHYRSRAVFLLFFTIILANEIQDIKGMGTILGAALASVVCFVKPVNDLIYYGSMIAVYLGILSTLYFLLRDFNLLITKPLPDLHNRGLKMVLLFLLISIYAFPVKAADTPYRIYIEDEENLLTEQEEKKLEEDMGPVQEYGHAAFITTRIRESDYVGETGRIYHSMFGRDSGMLLLIDMNHRQLVIFSDGAVYKTITKSKANTITDNIYKMASRGDYYGCAKEAFTEAALLLQGYHIAEPMRHVTNALLSLILSFLLVYLIARYISAQRQASHEELIAMIHPKQEFHDGSLKYMRKKRTYNPRSSGSGGSSGGGGSGGGGGGGGGSHGF